MRPDIHLPFPSDCGVISSVFEELIERLALDVVYDSDSEFPQFGAAPPGYDVPVSISHFDDTGVKEPAWPVKSSKKVVWKRWFERILRRSI